MKLPTDLIISLTNGLTNRHYINGELFKLVDVKQKGEAKPSMYIPKGSVASEMQAKKMV